MCLRYLPSTRTNVTVIKGKVILLNFILRDLSKEVLMPELHTTPVPRAGYQLTEQIPDNQQVSTPEPQVPRQDFSRHSYSDMEEFLRWISSVYSSLAHLYSIGQSVLGKELYVMKISSILVADEPGSSLEEICLCNIRFEWLRLGLGNISFRLWILVSRKHESLYYVMN